MKMALFSSVVVVLGMSLLVVAQTTKPATKPAGTPVNAYCPVNKDDPIDATIKTEYKGQTIAFCCVHCPETFAKDPEQYIKGMK